MKIEMELFAVPKSDAVYFECHYQTALFRHETVVVLMNMFTDLIFQVIRDPKQELNKYSLSILDDNQMGSSNYATTFDTDDKKQDTEIVI